MINRALDEAISVDLARRREGRLREEIGKRPKTRAPHASRASTCSSLAKKFPHPTLAPW